jgi:endoglucanase
MAPARSAEGQVRADFHRGVAIGHHLAWAPVAPGSRAFMYPPFADSGKQLTEELQVIRRAGFDFVRLAVDPGPFLQFQGSRRDELDRILLDRVDRILAAGLSVIVDFHPSDMQDDYRAEVLTRGLNEPVFQAYLGLLARTAGLLARLPSSRVALEIMNEPPVTPEQWQPLLAAAYSKIRNASPRLLLVLDGGDEGSRKGLSALAQYKEDAAALLSFHYYDPYQFTHQGSSWNAARYLADVPYPALARPLQDSLSATEAKIASLNLSTSERSFALQDAKRQLESYRRSFFDRATIASGFDQIARWAHHLGMPTQRIILGEFGAKKNESVVDVTRRAERAQWFRDVREEAEAHGFVWASWVYRGIGGFALTRDDKGIEFDMSIIDALQGTRR